MGESKRIKLGNESSGIAVSYIKSRDALSIWGWYDQYVGIQGEEISFKDFCDRLGIDLGKKRWQK